MCSWLPQTRNSFWLSPFESFNDYQYLLITPLYRLYSKLVHPPVHGARPALTLWLALPPRQPRTSHRPMPLERRLHDFPAALAQSAARAHRSPRAAPPLPPIDGPPAPA